MLFNSIQYLLFLPLVVIIYFLLPPKYRWLFLLISSYFFYMCWDAKYAILIATSTIITYFSGIFISKQNILYQNKKIDKDKCIRNKKLFVAFSLISNLAILGFFKYTPMALKTIDYLSNALNFSISTPEFRFLLPVGISFYTFQALSYTLDIYRGDIKATMHFGKYALFVSFFPQLVAGPIERSSHLLPQFDKTHVFEATRARNGILLILWGLFKKVVIADSLALAVDVTYGGMNAMNPISYLYVTFLFAFQIFCDFSGYSDIARGSAKIIGYDIMQNFRRPYFATSIKEFWRRWHISLSTWFKDYLYFPLGGSRVSSFKWIRNILVVFVVSGLWHGANWTFVIWGFLHGIYQLIGKYTEKAKERIMVKINLSRDNIFVKGTSIVITFSLVCFGWIFFRASNLQNAFTIIKSIFSLNNYIFDFTSVMQDTGYSLYNIFFSFAAIMILLVVQLIQSKWSISDFLERRNWLVRGAVYFIILLAIILFGEYGTLDSSFIYFQF